MHHSSHSTVIRLVRLLIAASLLLSLSITATAAAPVSMLAGQPELVKDIQNMNGSSSPTLYTAVGDAFYFSATDETHGRELWRSEGTTETTAMVADLFPGPEGSVFITFSPLDNERFIFVTSDPNYVSHLWVSDGTAAGTSQLMTNFSATTSIGPFETPLVLNGEMYLSAYSDGAQKLWRTNGTKAGTVQVSDLPLSSQNFALFDGWLYFAADGSNGKELYRINSTVLEPVLVKDICADTVSCGSEPGDSDPQWLVAAPDRVYFVARDPVQGLAVWSTTGTEESTTLVSDLDPALNGTDTYERLTPVGSRLYFVGSNGVTGSKLWRIISPPHSPYPVVDLAPGEDSTWIYEMMPLGNTLFFSARVFPEPYILYKTTGSGYEKLDPDHPYGGGMIRDDSTIYYSGGSTSANTSALWKVTESSTPEQIITYRPSYFSQHDIEIWKGNLLFTSGDSIHGSEPWISDGTAEGTRMLMDLRNGKTHDGVYLEAVRVMAIYKGNIYFEGQRGLDENGLWRSDGTGVGTEYVAPMNDYIEWYSKGQMTVSHDLLYFSAGGSLWRTDGSKQGTLQIPDIYTDQMISAGDRLFINGSNTAVRKSGIWRLSKGESAPTMISEVNAIHMGALGSEVLFVNWDRTLGIWELWRTDGTTVGTHRIYGPVAAVTEYLFYPFTLFDQMVAFDDRLFFLAPLAEGSYPLVLYATDGETVTPITSATGEPRFPTNLVVAGDSLYFSGMNGADSVLWRLPKGSDTAQVVYTTATNVTDYNSAEIPVLLADLGGKLVFSANEPQSGRRMLWLSDSTPAGTAPICPGCGYKGPGYSQVVVTEGKLYFPAYHPAYGSELWVSDGTDEGTRILAEVVPGLTGSSPAALTLLGSRLLFHANDGVHGRELWRYDLATANTSLYLPLVNR